MTEPTDSPREGRLSDTELSALRTHLVQLIIQQGTIFSNWVKFAITVQGGLAAGLGAVLLSALAKYRLLGLIIAIFGVATTALFAKILRELAGTPEIFPREGQIPEQVKWKDLGPVIRSILIFLAVVAIAWGVVFVWLLGLDHEALPPNPSFKTWNNCPPNYTVQGGCVNHTEDLKSSTLFRCRSVLGPLLLNVESGTDG
jgi:hypothetical protein